MDKLSALWQGASYQDKLLQAYRNLNLTLQSLFIAIGIGLTVAVVMASNSTQATACYTLLLIISLPALYLLLAIKKMIGARAEDVNYFLRQIIEFEKSLPKDEQVLTAFKVYQKFGRKEEDSAGHYLNFPLDDFVRKQLIEKGKGHTRKILDQNLSYVFVFLWIACHVISVLNILNR